MGMPLISGLERFCVIVPQGSSFLEPRAKISERLRRIFQSEPVPVALRWSRPLLPTPLATG